MPLLEGGQVAQGRDGGGALLGELADGGEAVAVEVLEVAHELGAVLDEDLLDVCVLFGVDDEDFEAVPGFVVDHAAGGVAEEDHHLAEVEPVFDVGEHEVVEGAVHEHGVEDFGALAADDIGCRLGKPAVVVVDEPVLVDDDEMGGQAWVKEEKIL